MCGNEINRSRIDYGAANADQKKHTKFFAKIAGAWVTECPTLVHVVTICGRGNERYYGKINHLWTRFNPSQPRQKIEYAKINDGVNQSNHSKTKKLASKLAVTIFWLWKIWSTLFVHDYSSSSSVSSELLVGLGVVTPAAPLAPCLMTFSTAPQVASLSLGKTMVTSSPGSALK